MYIPPAYQVTDPQEIFDFLLANCFGSLITVNDNRPMVTHLPFIFKREAGNLKVWAHMAQANPQAQQLDKKSALVTFVGPNTHVSSRLYQTPHSISTWNYQAVHLSGTIRVIPQAEQVSAVLHDLVTQNDAQHQELLNDIDHHHHQGLYPEIVAFEIQVSSIEACWKLNQHHSAERNHLVVQALSQSPQANDQAVAAAMAQAMRR